MSSKKKVVYLTTNHNGNDDRIYYHFKSTFESRNYDFFIYSTYAMLPTIKNVETIDGNKLSKTKKLAWFLDKLENIKPDIIICGEPFPILSATKYRKKNKCKIIYDVTEWYPSKKHLENLSFIKKSIKGFLMFTLHVYTSFKTQGIIVGEYHKKRFFDVFLPHKPSKIISYFPKKEFLSTKKRELNTNEFTIGYSGRLSKEKGIHKVFSLVNAVQQANPKQVIKLILIGKTYNINEEKELEKLLSKHQHLNIVLKEFVPFHEFKNNITKFDVALDLRNIDFENTRCLPIKIFNYCGCGIPVIYSDLKAIRKIFPNVNFIKLTDTKNLSSCVKYISSFIQNQSLYSKTSKEALEYIHKSCVWETLEEDLISFIEKIK